MTKAMEDLFFNLVYFFDALVIGLVLFLSRKKNFEKKFWFIALYCFINSACNFTSFSVFFAVFIVCYSSFGNAKGLDSVPIGIETILLFIYSFYYFYEQMNDVTGTFIYNKPSFWIIVGMMLYLGGSFFIYVFTNHIERQLLDQYWFLTYLFYILKNILFFIGLMFYTKKSKNPSPPAQFRPYLN
ncbi:MAG: hypothetical protein ABR503_08070 [Chitinophagaceae bacterium]